ncbi:MAG: membrane fusion protein (multidrug efflux system) [Saprospiraceae bacterium]|jgi:membrane fusion protein (multidrug efflux system)
MKKIGITALSLLVILTVGCDQSISDLKDERKELVAEHEVKLQEIDSLIANLKTKDTSTVEIKYTAVTTQSVSVKTFEHFFEVHGNVKAEENAALYAQAPGNVQTIHVREGQNVKKGELIISLDASTVESSIKELQTAYELVNKVYEKQSNLWKQKIGSELQYLEAKTNKETMSQKLKTVKEQLDMYKIRAPFSGVVDAIMPKVGEAAMPGYPVARILNLSKVYLEAEVSESYLPTVKSGSFLEIKFPALNESITAKVTRVGNFINPANRTFKVRVEVNNPGGTYKPNQLAVLKIRDYEAKNALVIPARIVQQDREGQDYVYTIKKKDVQRVKKLILNVGQSYEGQMEILSGLDSNTVIIDKGAKSVQANDAIEIK